jgi:hypothetical protein
LIRLDHDIPVGWAIHEIHLVLKAGASAANDGNAEGTAWTALLVEQGAKAFAGSIEHANEFFISDPVLNSFHRFKGIPLGYVDR